MSQQDMNLLQEELVEVDVGRALVTEWVDRVGKTSAFGPGLQPAIMEHLILLSALNGEAVLALFVFSWVTEWACCISHEVGLGTEISAVFEPVSLNLLVSEISGLVAEGLLLSVGAIEWVNVGEKFFGTRFGNLPGWIPHHGMKARAGLMKYIREFQLPVEKTHLLRHAQRKRQGLL